ncbi:hypothetical protein C8P68_105110 [Mucilaginibacter yixingensis]|uniref:Uncharacterized protein n=1 Tax=Mucilaginibacter yixingensis TaxID=1295612 RepID=A0A2T5J821_9SPHI|nr:hypothetical protein [Mucilaginibacter yixingensis]PTQ95605.1 hypothetical protein C8P68_105110 [Mucilaginibacter yixingensis]
MKSTFTTLVFCFLSLLISAQQKSVNKNKGDIALDMVGKLPEVKKFVRQYKDGALLLYKKPDSDFHFYWIKMGNNKVDMFATLENFYVEPKTYKVFYVDVFADFNPITLAQWRKWRNSPNFHELHTYKRGRLILQKQ